ncbi:MAG: transcriptional attenuator, LytR family [Actinomycetia bacterium]|nr:transcriptional attenuator, LytR family [Actinomycetes bacterium]
MSPPVFLRRFAIAFVITVVLATSFVLVGDAYERKAFNHSKKVHLANGVLHPKPPGQPANYLLIGSDSRATTDVGSNADTMMVLHVEPATNTGFLVSFPRDLVVNIPDHGQNLQLNAAYGLGGTKGAELVIRTLEANFAPLTIQHYIEVDFNGFKDIVNAIGKIHLWFPTPVHDPYLGLDVANAGCISTDGQGALNYARSRHYYIPDNVQSPAPWSWHWTNQTPGQESGYANGWSTSGTDIDRIPRQQYFLRTVSQAAVDKTARNPTKLIGLLNAVQSNFAHDDTLKLGELKALIRTFNRLDPTRVDMTTLPWVAGTGAFVNRVQVKHPEADAVVARLANLAPPKLVYPTPIPPSKIKVRVVNGSGVKGLAQQVLDQFLAAGFKSGGAAADADRDDYAQTQVRFAPGKGGAGVTTVVATGTNHVAEALSAKATLGGDVLVIIGRDWNQLRHNFKAPVRRKPGATSSSTKSPASSMTSTSTTSTTQPSTLASGYVPLDPKTGGPLVGCPN